MNTSDEAPHPTSTGSAPTDDRPKANGAHRLPRRLAGEDAVAVIGLGRFGAAVARTLEAAGVQVLAIDSDPQLVAEFANELTFVAAADSRSHEALAQLAIPDFARVVVGIGANVEASILTVSHLVDMGVPQVWAKALTNDHARILRQLGVSRVIQPEAEMGAMLAGEIVGHAMPGPDGAAAPEIPRN